MNIKNYALCFLLSLAFISCKKEETYVYGVNDVDIKQPGGTKSNVKSTQEFISIAYSDLFGANITQAELQKLNLAYSAFGDKKMIEDMIILNYLKKPGLIIPAPEQMRSNIQKFVMDSYKKFLNREANEYEIWYMTSLITSDATLTPEIFYYSMLTSEEYRYY
jgi:hypothetical protein